MEEITLSTPVGRTLEAPSHDVASMDSVIPVPELRDRLLRDIVRTCKARDRVALTASGRRRRQEDFETAMKSLVKRTASEVTRPIVDRASRMAARTRIYAAMMVLVESAARDREAIVRQGRTARRNSIILTLTAMIVLGLLAVSKGWIALPIA